MTASITANGNVLHASSGTSYEWYFNGNLISGANNSTYTALQDGSYVVKVFDNGCNASSVPFIFSATACTAVPPQPGSIIGNSNPCIGSSETYSIASVNGALSYSWILPYGWSGTSTNNSITVTTGTDPGSIYVIAVNACGISPATSFPVLTSSVIAYVTYSNHVLFASPGTSFEWYLDGNIIPGATSQSYTPTQIGDYLVVVHDNGCSGSSAPYYIASVGINDLADSQYQISVFPNPASEKIAVDVPEELRNSNLLIYNVTGQVIYQTILQSGKNIIDVSKFSEGIYNAIAIKENYKSVKHILISR
jgi:PKD-like domain/Secretion system C-terminal sorting domain